MNPRHHLSHRRTFLAPLALALLMGAGPEPGASAWPLWELVALVVTAGAGAAAGVVWQRRRDSRIVSAGAAKLRRTIQDLATSERYLEDFFETAPIAMHWVGADGTILRANRAELGMLGYTRDEFVGRNIAEFHADPEALEDILCRLAKGEVIREREATLRCKDGSLRTALISGSALFERGSFVHTRCFTRDVTDLRRAESHYKTIVETANEGVWLIDAQARTLYVNERMAAMLGHTPEQMAGRPVTDFCFPEDVPSARARMGHNFDGQPEQFDFRFRHLDGHGVPVLACTNAVRNADGRIAGALGLFTDVTARKRADEELRRFKFMCDAANDAYFLADLDGRLRYVNRTACDLLGYTQEELLALSVPEIDAVYTIDRFRALADELALRSRLAPFESILRRKDGSTVDIELSVSRVMVGGLPHLFGVGRDISPQRRARADLRRSEEILRLACRAAGAGAWDFEVASQRLTLTPEFRELFGVDEAAEFTFEAWMALVHPEDRAPTEAQLRLAWTGQSEPRLEYRIVRPDGALRWIESRWVTLTESGEGGGPPRPVRMVGIAQDVTDRRQADAALARSEARYRLLAENVPQFIWTCGPDGSVNYFNQRWHDYTGLDPEHSLGSGWADAIHPEDAPAALERWSRTLHHAQRTESEFRIRRADGQYRWFLARTRPLLDDRGGVAAWFATATDIHEQKLAQAALADLNTALARSNRDLEDFAHIAAHDLREPLRGMRLCASFLLEDHAPKLDEDGRRQLASIDRLGKRMDELINSLLHYSLVGQAELAIGPVDLNEIVGGIVESLGPVLRQTHTQVRIPAPLPTIRADAVRIGEVFRNLITNAVKYNVQPERWIEIGVRPPQNGDSTSVLYVRDNGIGIPPEQREAVFRIFKRLHARDEFGGGTGSGLALAKRIVERHGGRIWVESSLDEGSTFLFTLAKVTHAPVELADSHR